MVRAPYDDELAARVEAVNACRRALLPGAASRALLAAEASLEDRVPCSRRLAVYGTLAPGGAAHGMLAALDGRWHRGFVRGVRFVGRCGSARGYPALRLDLSGEPVPVAVLESADLPRAFPALDAYEGEAYRRVVAPVWDDGGLLLIANVYEVVEPAPPRNTAT